MTAAPTPATVAPAHVVRVRMMSGRVHAGPILTPREAAEAADELQLEVGRADTGTGFVRFRTETETGPIVRLRADRIESIEPVRPPAHRDRKAAPVVHVHLHTTDAPEGAEPYLGLSTERVLELIRAEQRGTFDPRAEQKPPRAEQKPPRCKSCGMLWPHLSTAEFFEARATFDPRPAATLQQEDALPDEFAGGAL